MAMASTRKVVLGSIAYGFFWVLAVFPSVPFLPIGRTAGALLGAVLMILFRVITPDEAYEAIDLRILAFLFGTMVVSIYLERADMFKYLGKLLTWKSRGGKDLLFRVCLVSAISSALFTNDTSCVVLTEFILKIAIQNNLPPQPFLLALASSSNIGSAATPIGNPQNLVIAVRSKISFEKFLFGILPSMILGVLVNAAILLCYFWKLLSIKRDQEVAAEAGDLTVENEMNSQRNLPMTMTYASFLNSQNFSSNIDAIKPSSLVNAEPLRTISMIDGEEFATRYIRTISRNNSTHAEEANILPNCSSSVNSQDFSSDIDAITLSSLVNAEPLRTMAMIDGEEFGSVRISQRSLESSTRRYIRSVSRNGISHAGEANSLSNSEARDPSNENWKISLWKIFVYVVTIGMLFALLLGFDMSWTVVAAALTLVLLDFKDARPCLEKVSYLLLIFFCGMFISVDGFNKTGIPNSLWEAVERYSRISNTGGIAMLSVVILVLSNVASNVPTVLLLGTRVAASAASISASEEVHAWLILAWVSTVAGNLSLLGSAANLIVCEQAQRSQFRSYNLTFWSHLKFGVPSTIIVIAIGLPLIRSY